MANESVQRRINPLPGRVQLHVGSSPKGVPNLSPVAASTRTSTVAAGAAPTYGLHVCAFGLLVTCALPFITRNDARGAKSWRFQMVTDEV